MIVKEDLNDITLFDKKNEFKIFDCTSSFNRIHCQCLVLLLFQENSNERKLKTLFL
jgi:hypothetical protein